MGVVTVCLEAQRGGGRQFVRVLMALGDGRPVVVLNGPYDLRRARSFVDLAIMRVYDYATGKGSADSAGSP